VGKYNLKVGDKVQTNQDSQKGRKVGDWGVIANINYDLEVTVRWNGGSSGKSNCHITHYNTGSSQPKDEAQDNIETEGRLRLNGIVRGFLQENKKAVGTWVKTDEKAWYAFRTNRAAGEWGQITSIRMKSVTVKWLKKDSDAPEAELAELPERVSDCEIKAYRRNELPIGKFLNYFDTYSNSPLATSQHIQRHNRDAMQQSYEEVFSSRRMAQREFSSRRDSPVMARLLQEIVRANQKHNELN